jgi:NAD-dependent dihydropyrimidine dehydrogenase PreA subunit
MGIPREKIPWAPSIEQDTCTGCGECKEVCPNGVFELDEAEGKMKVVHPDNCVVLCDKCAGFCPTESIHFPDKAETKKLIGQLLRERDKAAGS